MFTNKKIITVFLTLILGFLFTYNSNSQELCGPNSFPNGAVRFQPVFTSSSDFVGGLLGTYDQSSSGNVTGGMDWFALREQNKGTSGTGPQLISWWTRDNNRNTTLQATNHDPSNNAVVHVQIFGEDCLELIDFCDVYTPGDTHVYDFSNLTANTGQIIGTGGLVGREGIAFITTVEECDIAAPSYRAIVFPDFQGDVTISDDSRGFDYHAKMWSRRTDTLFTCSETTVVGGYTILDGTGDCKFRTLTPIRYNRTFSILPGSIASRSDVVLFSFVDQYGPTTYTPVLSTSTMDFFSSIYDENEVGESCPTVNGCFLRLGLNASIPNSDSSLPDSDMDGVLDIDDNCPSDANSEQSDIDGDGAGDVCDPCPNDATDTCDPTGSAAEEIDPATGGTVMTPDGMLTLDVEPGELTSTETISVTEIMPGDPEVDLILGPNTGLGLTVAAYDLQPDGLNFNPTATLTIVADVSSLNATQRDNLDLYIYDDITSSFVALGAVCVVTELPAGVFTAECTAEIMHFTDFGLVAPLDSDGDGVPDDFPGLRNDRCPDSIFGPTVVIGDCDSGVENVLLRRGCTISDRIERCAVKAWNHGQFVKCVVKLNKKLKRRGILNRYEAKKIKKCAVHSELFFGDDDDDE